MPREGDMLSVRGFWLPRGIPPADAFGLPLNDFLTNRLIIMNRVLCFTLILVVGCRNGTAPDVVVDTKKTSRAGDDKVAFALEAFRQGGDQARYRDALTMLSPSLGSADNAARFTLKPEQRKSLEADAKLTPAEIQELDATFFRPMDAAHVDAAALFRDAARALEIPGLGELDQAEFAFDWVARRVLLFEQRQEGLPPAYVLRAGYGSATDRGLVFLALLHQFKLDGCLFVAPEMRDVPLVGVLIQKNLYLFDTRLGQPVPGPGGKSTATWAEAVKQPEMLKNSKLSAEQIAKLEARLAIPLESLAPRMKYLESLLQGDESHVGGDRLAVSHDIEREVRDLEAAGGGKVGLWTPALRIARQFESVENGGLDQTRRADRFAINLIPSAQVIKRYQELRIYRELPTLAQPMFVDKMTAPLFELYHRQPGEMLIRGRYEALPRRLDRIRTVVEDADAANPNEEKELIKQAAAWRERVNAAYGAFIRKDPDGEAKVKAIWEEDHYLLYLMQPELEEAPRGVTKTVLSRLILAAVREPLAARVNWLFASLSQDKAERAQETLLAQKEAGKETKAATASARNAWLNARSAWTKYLDRNNLGPGLFASSLPELRFYLHNGDTESMLSLWEYMHRETHQYAAARLEQAQAMEHTGQNAAALLDLLAKELSQLQGDETLAKERTIVGTSGILNLRDPQAREDAQRRWRLLQRDWGPDGNFAWLLESVRLARKPGG